MPDKKTIDLNTLEKKELSHLRNIMWALSSSNKTHMYDAASKITRIFPVRPLLPITMTLLHDDDKYAQKLYFRTAARNMITPYLDEFFRALDTINPAEREQVLQNIEEQFNEDGAPVSASAQKKWVECLTRLDHEHQPTVVGIMVKLGTPGISQIKRMVRQQTDTFSLKSIPKLKALDKRTRSALIKVICQKAGDRPEVLSYMKDLIDKSTLKYLLTVLKNGTWQIRSEIAAIAGQLGITSSRGIVMDIIGDENWRVKQSLLENINISKSKFSALTNLLNYLVYDSHARVRSLAEKVLLLMGNIQCIDSDLETQRVKLEKKFRKQLLNAAAANTDIDSKWMGISREIIDVIPRLSEEDESTEGITLNELSEEEEEEEPIVTDLLAALKARQEEVISPTIEDFDFTTMSVTDIIIVILKDLAPDNGAIPIQVLKEKVLEQDISEADFQHALTQLEREGVVYRPKKDTIRSTDIDV